MAKRNATAKWQGGLQEGGGTVSLGTGVLEAPFSFSSRFEDGAGTNPDELMAASLAACFTMQLSGVLGNAGHSPESLETETNVTLRQSDDGLAITRIDLALRGSVPGIDQDEFAARAREAKDLCAVSNALAAVDEITLDAKLEG
jgi:osmotically inducible protein OsmC